MALSSPRHAATGAAALALVVLWTSAGHTQLTQAPVARAITQDTSAPAIERGMRDQDPPRDARTGANSAHARGDAEQPYLRGSIIVKFSDAATRGSISAATAQVAGDVADRSNYADFDIVDIPMNVDPEAAAAALR